MNINECRADFGQFKEEYPKLGWWIGFFILLAYGGRVIHDNIFLDSEIMLLRPEFMREVWLGSSRFGLVLTDRLFGMGRLVPWLSGVLMALSMWAGAVALAFCAYEWCQKSRRYRIFLYLFPALFVTCPVFAGQYLFILQAFELAFAILLCILAAGCTGNFVYRGGGWGWLAAGLGLMVWAFGSYQAMLFLYFSLVLFSFLLIYMNRGGEGALGFGLKHMAVFLAGAAIYGIIAALAKASISSESTYISELVHWRTDGWRMCLSYIWLELVRVLRAKSIFYHPFYLPAMGLFVWQAMVYGWKKKTGIGNYFWFLLGGGLFLASPFFLTVLTGFLQQVRAQMVYPVTLACFVAHLTVLPENFSGEDGSSASAEKRRVLLDQRGLLAQKKLSGKTILTGVFTALAVFVLSGNTVCIAQLFHTAWEAYRNDILTANRIYADICHVANRPDMENCCVIFTGRRDAGLAGPVTRGELTGLSIFEAEAHTPTGVSGRVVSLFLTLGMDLRIEIGEELYQQAVEFMQDAPDWPAQGSIREMDGFIVVRLSGVAAHEADLN